MPCCAAWVPSYEVQQGADRSSQQSLEGGSSSVSLPCAHLQSCCMRLTGSKTFPQLGRLLP